MTNEPMTNEPMVNDQSGDVSHSPFAIRHSPCIIRILLLAGILLAGAYLRFTNLNWDEGKWIHPDESHMQQTLDAIRVPDSLSLYFDTPRSPLNVWSGERTYSYGTLPLYLTRVVAEWLDRACGESPDAVSLAAASLLVKSPDLQCSPGTFSGGYGKQIGRALSGLADLGTILLVYLLGRRLYGPSTGSGQAEAAGLLAAALMALTAFSIQQAHFFTVDSMLCFFVTLTVYFAVRAGRSGNGIDFALAGLATGLATACKISAATAALLVALAAVVWVWSRPAERRAAEAWKSLAWLVLAGVLALVAFRVAQPGTFEGPGFFGLRLNEYWLNRLRQILAEQSGIDSPPSQQWTDRTPLLFPWVNMVVWGMGLPLGLAAWIGWAVMGVELWRGRRIHLHLILWVWASLMFLYLGTRWAMAMRYFIFLYPLFVLMAAYVLIRLCRAVSREWRRLGYAFTVLVVVGAALWAYAVFSVYLRPHTRIAASHWICANVPQGATIATEHWDWPPPLPVEGCNPGAMYSGVEMQNYNEDTPEKREQFYAWLDQADYIVTGSNRIYASVSRLPARYPLTNAYYKALFSGALGFELVADFTSAPAIGPFQFPDQETPWPLPRAVHEYQPQEIVVPLPPAEEAFSVYDHPRVMVFHKTAAYSRQRVEALLGGIDLDRAIHGLTPLAATAARNLLWSDGPAWQRMWAEQQAGGTWSEMFNRRSLLNRYPGLAAVAWWVVVTVLGWLAFPLLFVALPRLRDRGYGVARVLALLLIAYLTWLAASLHVLPNTRATIVRAVLLLVLVGGGVGWLRRDALRRFVRDHWRLIVLTEGLFAALYIAWIFVRLLQPDLWHPNVGGEKPMDFAYFNAVLKSTWFPPYNPWFSGTTMNYYYFGFVLVGTLVKLIGTVPAIAYNLAVPLLFALTGVGAFSVAYNFFGGQRRGALRAGIAALVFTVGLGNLGVVHLVGNALISLGGPQFPSTIPGFPQAVAFFRGAWRVIAHGVALPVSTSSWYWFPTRIIPHGEYEAVPITEFPAFTFLYGDLHANMIALPLVLLALALAVCWVRSPRPHWASLLLGSLVFGALLPTHTWDYPTYLLLGVAALALGMFAARDSPFTARLKAVVWRVALLVALSFVFYLPYLQHYAAGYTAIERWRGTRTPVDIYLWIHGIFLFPLLTRLLIETYRACRCAMRRSLVVVLTGLAVLVVVAVVLAVLGYPVALVTLPAAALAALLLFAPKMPLSRRLLWLTIGGALLLGLAAEIIVLKGDVARMNTVFRFYQQAWVLFAVAAGVSLAWLYERARRWRAEWRRLWWIGMAVLVLGGALFLPCGIRARAIDRMSPQTGLTLDGMAFMRTSTVFDGAPERGGQEIPLVGDYYAIQWMQDHIQGSPVILEGIAGEYHWANRVSIHTGLPAVIGWDWHERQQRAVLPATMVDSRRADVNECYNTTDVSRALGILGRYGVRYVYVGDYERAFYDPAGLAKFDAMADEGLLQVVYDAQGVRIYEVLVDLTNSPPPVYIK
jgi:YYY domain-containing protein